MGVVYKARQIYINQTVALKVLPPRYLDDPQAVSRFRREMQSIGGLIIRTSCGPLTRARPVASIIW